MTKCDNTAQQGACILGLPVNETTRMAATTETTATKKKKQKNWKTEGKFWF